MVANRSVWFQIVDLYHFCSASDSETHLISKELTNVQWIMKLGLSLLHSFCWKSVSIQHCPQAYHLVVLRANLRGNYLSTHPFGSHL